MVKLTKKQLAKIYYQNREVRYIDIEFADLSHKIDIGSVVDISGQDEIIRMDYVFHLPEDDKEKELSVSFWDINNHLDKVQVNHKDSGIVIDWISHEGGIKSSLFIPIDKILHIHVDDPKYGYDEKPDEEIIER